MACNPLLAVLSTIYDLYLLYRITMEGGTYCTMILLPNHKQLGPRSWLGFELFSKKQLFPESKQLVNLS
jgi:hypothetical protein